MATVEAARQKQVVECFEQYYAAKGDDRNDPLRNPGTLFQNLAFDKSVVQALQRVDGDKRSWKILDVGCGAGFSLLRLLAYGIEPERLHGIDIAEHLVTRGRRRFPALHLTHGDATAMDYESHSFDLAMESTMFIQLMDESICQGIATEILRVVKPNGYIMLTDWRYSFGRPGVSGAFAGENRPVVRRRNPHFRGVPHPRGADPSAGPGALAILLLAVLPGVPVGPCAGGPDDGGLAENGLSYTWNNSYLLPC